MSVIRIEACVGRATCLTRLGHGSSTSRGAPAPASASLWRGGNQRWSCHIVRGILRLTGPQILTHGEHLCLTFGLTTLPTQSVVVFPRDCWNTVNALPWEGSLHQHRHPSLPHEGEKEREQ